MKSTENFIKFTTDKYDENHGVMELVVEGEFSEKELEIMSKEIERLREQAKEKEKKELSGMLSGLDNMSPDDLDRLLDKLLSNMFEE